MGSKNLKQRSVSFAKDVPKHVKAKLVGIKGAVISFIEKLVGRPVTAVTKKKAAMRITDRPEFIRLVVRNTVVKDAEPVIEPGFVIVESVREVPVIIEIQDSVSCSTSIDVSIAEVIPEVKETVEEQSEIFDDGFDTMRVCGISALAATSTSAAPSTSAPSFIMDFDDWDLGTECVVAEIVEESDDTETATEESNETVPVIEETEEEKAFFADLYDEIVARCLYDDVLPAMIPWFYEEIELFEDLYKDLATESLVNDVLPKLVPELFGENKVTETTVADTVDANQTLPVVAPVPEKEIVSEKKADAAESAFLEKLYSDIEAYIIFTDILPQIQADETFVPGYVISSIESNESAETRIEIEAPKAAALDSFINGSVTFSFGYSKTSECPGPTKFSFIMGTPDDAVAEDECEDSVRSSVGAQPVMAASQQGSRVYL